MEHNLQLLNFPVIVFEKIIGYLSYDEIAKKRLVCKTFNVTCQRLLNRGFHLMEKRHNASLRAVKAKLPRRESERRFHPMARHCDILTSIETRISMLSMTYTKYIDQNLCSFIPGKVIDEILRVLRLLDNSQAPPRAHEVLQELRDISSMAIEHFDEKISPALKQNQGHSSNTTTVGGQSFNLSNLPCQYQPEMLLPMRNITQGMLRSAFNRMSASSKLNQVACSALTRKTLKMGLRVKRYNSVMLEQKKIIREQNNKITDQNVKIAELRRRIDEWDAKYRELMANINQINTQENKPAPSTSKKIDVIKPASANLTAVIANLTSSLASVPKLSNIKPRSAQITLKRSLPFDFKKDDEKKVKCNK